MLRRPSSISAFGFCLLFTASRFFRESLPSLVLDGSFDLAILLDTVLYRVQVEGPITNDSSVS